MEEEEIALKKQLEASKDFEERREIRQKLRKLRQQKLEALESDSSGQGGRRRREHRTETTTSTTSDGITVTEKHTTKTEIIENGDVLKSEEDVVVKTEVEPEPEPEAEPEAEAEPEPEPEIQLDQGLEVEQELEEEEQPPEEDQENDEGDVPFYMQKNPEELTENDIGDIDDLEFLEATLNDLPLKFFEVRKHLRAQIRKVKVNRGASSRHTLGNVAHLKKKALDADRKSQSTSRQGKGEVKSSVFERTSKFGERTKMKKDDIKRSGTEKTDGKIVKEMKENGETKHEKENTSYRKNEYDAHDEEYRIETLASDTLLKKLDGPIEIENTEKERKQIDSEDDESSISSRSATSSTSDLENAPPSPPPSSGAKEKSGTAAAPAHRIEGLQPGLQAKKTDFRSQLKRTGINPKMNIAVSGKISSLAKKDAQEPMLDLRKNLKSVPGAVPLTRRGSGSERYGPSLRERPKKDEVDTAEPGEGKRKISSTDLFNLVSKPKDTQQKDADYSKQRGVANKPATQSYKYEPPKIVGAEDESFQVLMSQRKKEIKRQHTPADLKPGIKLSNRTTKSKPEWSARQLQKPQFISPKSALPGNDDEGDLPPDIPDNQIDEILKDVDVDEIEVEKLPRKLSAPSLPAPISPRRNRKLSSGNIKWIEGPQIDIQDKNQLSMLRQQLEEQKRLKEAGGTTITEEKTTTTDGSTTTTTKTTEKRGPGGSTTVTKTTTTRTGGMGRAGARNIEAELARKKKERMSAKAAAFKNVKDQRNAFKEKLEAQNPKPAGGAKKSFQSPNTAVNALLEWCRRKTRGYGIDLQNYTTSWADGMAMCAIFHYFSPDLIPWETLNPNDRKRNWTLAFDAAYAEGLDPILELEDVLRSKVPEPKSLITYVHSIYQHFHDKAEKAKLEKEQAA